MSVATGYPATGGGRRRDRRDRGRRACDPRARRPHRRARGGHRGGAPPLRLGAGRDPIRHGAGRRGARGLVRDGDARARPGVLPAEGRVARRAPARARHPRRRRPPGPARPQDPPALRRADRLAAARAARPHLRLPRRALGAARRDAPPLLRRAQALPPRRVRRRRATPCWPRPIWTASRTSTCSRSSAAGPTSPTRSSSRCSASSGSTPTSTSGSPAARARGCSGAELARAPLRRHRDLAPRGRGAGGRGSVRARRR